MAVEPVSYVPARLYVPVTELPTFVDVPPSDYVLASE